MSTILLRAAVLVAVLGPLAGLAAPLSLEAALELALQRSEAARAARAGLASATEAATAAGRLPDPTLRVGIENLPVTGGDRFSLTRESMTMKRIGIGQEWLSPAKRSARQAAAEAAVGKEAVTAQAATAEVRLQTALAYIDALYARQDRELTALAERHAREELEVARGRLAAGSASSPEVLALSGARGVAEDADAQARQAQSAADLSLQRWTGTQPEGLLAVVVGAAVAEPAYVAGHPEVAALQRDVELARRMADMTALDRRPNWTWEVAYGQRAGYSDMVSVGVSIPLPVAPGSRQDRETAAKLALVDKAEAQLVEATWAASAEYRTLASDVQRLQERIERYRSSVLLAARQRTAVATAGYRSNQLGLATLFEARHAELEAERRLLAMGRELARLQARIAYRPIAPGALP